MCVCVCLRVNMYILMYWPNLRKHRKACPRAAGLLLQPGRFARFASAGRSTRLSISFPSCACPYCDPTGDWKTPGVLDKSGLVVPSWRLTFSIQNQSECEKSVSGLKCLLNELFLPLAWCLSSRNGIDFRIFRFSLTSQAFFLGQISCHQTTLLNGFHDM